MKIQSGLKDYDVIFEDGFDFIQKLSSVCNAQYVIDKNVYSLYKELFGNIPGERLLLIEASEQNKVIDTALEICEKMTDIPAKRNAVLISVGGGIIQDITGFVANIMYRGIKWIFVPTTLLASCDSCIGGKTSLNYKKYKNLLGTFYPPDEIHICPDFFRTLTDRDFKSGLGEVVKFNIMNGEKSLECISGSICDLIERESKTVNNYVRNSLAFKKKFIEIDEFDRNERIKLNFAHTFGHALEVISEYDIPHGTAVAIGMIMANSLSVKFCMMTEEFAGKSENVLLKVIDIDKRHLDIDADRFIGIMHKDKKQKDNNLTAVLMSNIDSDENQLVLRDITADDVKYAISYFCGLYRQNKDFKMK
ncbi:MAG: AroB-related putative sugar phosphate phospholyase (cyclizing) [Porcipelethomonas sp.]